MSKKEILNKIEILLSPKKVALYKEKYSDAWLDAYLLELEQSKEVFIYLHFLEIFLRNKIAAELSKDFGDWLFDPRCHLKLNFREQEKVSKVLVELNKTSKELNLDNVISSLNFGFWTNLFHKSYNYSIWQQNKVIERVFPYLKDYERNLNQIQKEMEAIRKFRNRIFHFESMQSWNFGEMKKLINKFIYGVGGVSADEILKIF